MGLAGRIGERRRATGKRPRQPENRVAPGCGPHHCQACLHNPGGDLSLFARTKGNW